MTAYIIRRLLIMPIILLGITMLIFGMLQVLGPIERSALYVRDIPKTDRQLDCYHHPLRPGQSVSGTVLELAGPGTTDGVTGDRVGGVLRGDLGYSRTGREPVIDVLVRRLPATLELAIWAMIPVIGFGIWLGVKSALNHNKLFDQVARVFAIIGWSFPTFVFALLMLLIFYARLDWFPARAAFDRIRPGGDQAGLHPIHAHDDRRLAAQPCASTSSSTPFAT